MSKIPRLRNLQCRRARAGDTLETIQTNATTAQDLISPLKSAVESDGMKMVREGFNTFVDSLPGMLKALHEVAQIHPFIGGTSFTSACGNVLTSSPCHVSFGTVAVGVFRVVVELDARRRDNDRKILVIFSEMRDMMAALLQ